MTLPRAALCSIALALAGAGVVGIAACSSADRTPVDVPAPRAPTDAERVGRWVGLLIGPDAEASREAEASLLALDERSDAALLAHANRIPTERDPRWLAVLDEHGLLDRVPRPPTPEERLDLLLWRASRPDRRRVLAAQSALLEIARRDPDLLVRRLAHPGSGRDVLAVTLANAGANSAVPALLDLYRRGDAPAERRAAALALGRLVGEDSRPRADGTPEERERDARRVEEVLEARRGGRDVPADGRSP